MIRMRTMAVLTLALGLLLAGAPAASAGSMLEGEGLVVAVNVAGSTVTVDDRVFQVDARTAIEDLDGRAITLAQVPTRDAPPNAMNQSTPGAVAYEAVASGGGWKLIRLSLTEGEVQ